MRILGFSKKWAKLNNDEFTTFRYRRKDAGLGRDWHNGETLKIVYHPRHEHEFLGIAQVIRKEPKQCQMITDEEAIADGFQDVGEMMDFLNPPTPAGMQIINKLTLMWLERSGE
uniref:ASCH domain-containing protein n=1 Tax=viral metagenome TaxID=1070528 RepID=A0A6M3LCY4_9ZZZZ